MPRPIGRTAYEVFGFSTGKRLTSDEIEDLDSQRCPFIHSECRKFRKSDPKTKIGSCVLGHKGKPVIVCPYRFNEPLLFRTIEERYFNGRRVVWIPEVALGDRGYVDYVAAVPNGNRDLIDFLCVEIQANGTTGTPWPAIEHFRKTYSLADAPVSTYGFNWSNEFTKTLSQQLLKKGSLIEKWGKKIVVVIQDSSLDYIRNRSQGLDEYTERDSIHFLPVEMDYQNDRWVLSVSSQQYSTDVAGIIQSLTNTSDSGFTVDEFQERIIEKGTRDGL